MPLCERASGVRVRALLLVCQSPDLCFLYQGDVTFFCLGTDFSSFSTPSSPRPTSPVRLGSEAVLVLYRSEVTGGAAGGRGAPRGSVGPPRGERKNENDAGHGRGLGGRHVLRPDELPARGNGSRGHHQAGRWQHSVSGAAGIVFFFYRRGVGGNAARTSALLFFSAFPRLRRAS